MGQIMANISRSSSSSPSCGGPRHKKTPISFSTSIRPPISFSTSQIGHVHGQPRLRSLPESRFQTLQALRQKKTSMSFSTSIRPIDILPLRVMFDICLATALGTLRWKIARCWSCPASKPSCTSEESDVLPYIKTIIKCLQTSV